jgi:hypothetical protein
LLAAILDRRHFCGDVGYPKHRQRGQGNSKGCPRDSESGGYAMSERRDVVLDSPLLAGFLAGAFMAMLIQPIIIIFLLSKIATSVEAKPLPEVRTIVYVIDKPKEAEAKP